MRSKLKSCVREGNFVGVVLFKGGKVAFQGFCMAQEDSRGSEAGRGSASTALRVSMFVEVWLIRTFIVLLIKKRKVFHI
jgi:hypothetical protein